MLRYCAVLPLLVVFCNQLIMKTTAQNDSIITTAPPMDVTSMIVSASSVVNVELTNTGMTFSAVTTVNTIVITNIASTSLIPTAVISTVEMTSPDMTPVDVLTLIDMINVSTVSVPSSTTNTIMMTSLLPMSSSFMMTIRTTAMASPVDTIDRSSIIAVDMTTVAMASSSNVQTVAITTVTTSKRNPVPAVPSDSDNEADGLSMGAIIRIAAGGGSALVVIFAIVICCSCCYHYRKHSQPKVHVVPLTIQRRPEVYATQISYGDELRDSQRSTVSISSQTSKVSKSSQTSKSKASFNNNLKSIRHSLRRAKEKGQVEDIKLISTPV